MDPLATLTRQIESAHELPKFEPHTPTVDPLSTLKAFVRGDSEPQNSNSAVVVNKQNQSNNSQSEKLGDVVFEIVSKRPLTPAARLESVQRCLIAMENPTPENVRAILESLISG